MSRRTFPIEVKLEAVQYAELQSTAAAARKFKVDSKQIRNWRRKRFELEKLLELGEKGKGKGNFRVRCSGGGRKRKLASDQFDPWNSSDDEGQGESRVSVKLFKSGAHDDEEDDDLNLDLTISARLNNEGEGDDDTSSELSGLSGVIKPEVIITDNESDSFADGFDGGDGDGQDDESEEESSDDDEDEGEVSSSQSHNTQTATTTTTTTTTTTAGAGENRKRKAFTIQHKMEVLKYLESHSLNATARNFQVGPSSLRLWRRQKANIQALFEVGQRSKEGEEDEEENPALVRKRVPGAGRKKRGKRKVEDNPNKRNRRSIKLSDKVEMIRVLQAGRSQSDVARSLGVAQSTVQTIWSNREEILERSKMPKKDRKNLKYKKYSSVDSSLSSWYGQCRETGTPVDGKMLLDKAVEFAEYYKQTDFQKQAPRWLKIFKKRHSIKFADGRSTCTSVSQRARSLPAHQNVQHQQIQMQAHSGQSSHPHQSQHIQPHFNFNPNPVGVGAGMGHDLMPLLPYFDFSSGLYPPPAPPPHPIPDHHHANSTGTRDLQSTPHRPNPNYSNSTHNPNHNQNLPTSTPRVTVTTCDAMKYVELIRSWISTTFREEEETKEDLNNHLNAIENAVLKRRVTEVLPLPLPLSIVH